MSEEKECQIVKKKKEESNLIERCSFKEKNFIYKTSKKKAWNP